METEARTCGYVLDSEDPSTWNGTTERCFVDKHQLDPKGRWHCSHPVEGDGTRCVFHQPVPDLSGAAVEAVRRRTTVGDRPTIECAGAAFGQFDLADEHTADRVWLPHATVRDGLDWSGATVDVSYLQLAGTTVNGPADFSECVFTGYTSFAGVQFGGEVTFDGARFQGPMDFRFGSVADTASFEGTTFEDSARFEGTTVDRDATFEGATFGDEATFSRVSVRGDLHFENAVVEGDASFASLSVNGDGYFEGATFGTDPDFSFAEFGDVDRSGIR